SGACRATTVKKTRGKVLCAVVQGRLRYAFAQEGAIRREDGSIVLETDAMASISARVCISGDATWVGVPDFDHARLVRVTPRGAESFGATAVFRGAPMFDANGTTCFGVVDDWLVDFGRGTRVGMVLGGQTWFRVGEETGFGFYRAGAITKYFVWSTARGGM